MNELPDELPDEISDQLRRAARAVAPSSTATAAVRSGLRRRRRRRALTSIAGSVAAVALVGGLAVALPGGAGPERPPGPAASNSPTTSESPAPAAFTCPVGGDLGDPPPLPDIAEQERIATRLRALDSVRVVYAAPTALGVVALVEDDSDDLDLRADPAVAARLADVGVAHTYEWQPRAPSGDLDGDGQVRRVVGWQLDPAMRDIRRAVRGIPGSAQLALWPEAGAVVVRWKAPVPEAVQELAGTRPDRVRVDIRPATYSSADVRRAQDLLQDWLRDTDRRGAWSSAGACADGSGLVVGMLPRAAEEPGLAEAIAEAVGMPVRVVPEDRPVDLRD